MRQTHRLVNILLSARMFSPFPDTRRLSATSLRAEPDLAGCVYNISTDRSKGGYGANYFDTAPRIRLRIWLRQALRVWLRLRQSFRFRKRQKQQISWGNISAFRFFCESKADFLSFSVLPAEHQFLLNHPRSFYIALRDIAPCWSRGVEHIYLALIGQACLRLFFAAQRSCLNTSYHRRIEVKQLAHFSSVSSSEGCSGL